jgi:4-amino-4-deoxy-L-arabinose transferase-like glycosyltransferase
LLIWAVANWLMFELVPTKLPHYVLPAYPPLAILAAAWMLSPASGGALRWQRALFYLSAALFLIGGFALAAAPSLATWKYGSGTPAWLLVPEALGGVLVLTAFVTHLRQALLGALGLSTAAALVLYPALTAGAAPRLSDIWISPRVAALVTKDSRPGDPPPIFAGYTEPSLLFVVGTESRLTNGVGAAQAGAYQGGLAFIEDHERPAFLARLAELETDATKVDELDGLNYSRGKPVHITVYRLTANRDVITPPAE